MNENSPINQSSTPPIASADYLDQIAPKKPKTGLMHNKVALFSTIIGVAVLLSIFLIVLTAVLPNNKTAMQQLGARLTATKEVVDSAGSTLTATKVRVLNSQLSIYMTNTIRDYTEILSSQNLDIKKLDEKIVAEESNEKLLATLEDARLNGVYDRKYAGEMAYQLSTTLNLMEEIYQSTDKNNIKEFLRTSYEDLKTIQEGFSNFEG